MITIKHTGNFKNTDNFFNKLLKIDPASILNKYAQQGVLILQNNTPKDTGRTGFSWSYEIQKSKNSYSIFWKNTNIKDGVPIAILLQYGHATRGGGYVKGVDYINPSLIPIFEKIAEDAWKEVGRL